MARRLNMSERGKLPQRKREDLKEAPRERLDEAGLLQEMASIGDFKDFQVKVLGEGRNIPHFHILIGDPKSPTWQSCPRLDKADYFVHHGIADRLNSEERALLMEFLVEPFRKSSRFIGSNWDNIVFQWNANNSQLVVPEDIPMPDYTQLP
jgi:hypothetical protein